MPFKIISLSVLLAASTLLVGCGDQQIEHLKSVPVATNFNSNVLTHDTLGNMLGETDFCSDVAWKKYTHEVDGLKITAVCEIGDPRDGLHNATYDAIAKIIKDNNSVDGSGFEVLNDKATELESEFPDRITAEVDFYFMNGDQNKPYIGESRVLEWHDGEVVEDIEVDGAHLLNVINTPSQHINAHEKENAILGYDRAAGVYLSDLKKSIAN